MEPACKRKKISPPHETGILDLPNEVLETIFLMLSQEDSQQNVALVCRRFLEITRSQNFVQDLKIELVPYESDDQYIDQSRVKKSCWERVEKVLKIYPQCKIELHFETMSSNDPSCYVVYDLIGYSWMGDFTPFAASITKLTLSVIHDDLDDFSNFIVLENLEYLDLTVVPHFMERPFKPQDLKAEFWKKLPKLKSLNFGMDRGTDDVRNDDFDKFTIPISSECQDLERFVYYGYYNNYKPDLKNLGAPSNDKDKFSNLKYIKAKFKIGCVMRKENLWMHDANLEHFKNYLTTKCPNLEIPIRIDVVKLEVTGPRGESGWTKYEEVTFESK